MQISTVSFLCLCLWSSAGCCPLLTFHTSSDKTAWGEPAPSFMPTVQNFHRLLFTCCEIIPIILFFGGGLLKSLRNAHQDKIKSHCLYQNALLLPFFTEGVLHSWEDTIFIRTCLFCQFPSLSADIYSLHKRNNSCCRFSKSIREGNLEVKIRRKYGRKINHSLFILLNKRVILSFWWERWEN